MNYSEYRDIIGPLLNRGPVNLAIVSETRCDGYSLMEIEYDVEIGERIKAYCLNRLV